MYTATIKRKTETENIKTVFEAEDKIFPNQRAQYNVGIEQNTLHINVQADDTKAFKAVLNSITTILDIYDRTESLTD